MAEKNKGVQVNTTLPAEVHAMLEEHRWDVRLTMTQLVRRALDEYAERHGLVITDAAPTDDAAAAAPVKASTNKA